MSMGLLHVYHGDGKGKTTAAIGLTVRAAGAGNRVIFSQFMKGGPTAELQILKELERVRILRSPKAFPFYSRMTELQKQELTEIHNQLIRQMLQAVREHSCQVLVLDEVTYPVSWGLLDIELLQELLALARNRAEVVCTGRNPAQWLLEQADYITEMRAVRHPYERGIQAREGIEW